MLYPTTWDALSTDRVIRLVKRRGVIQTAMDFYTSTDIIDLSELQRIGLSDGRTVNVHHFEALWEGLCLSTRNESLWRTTAHRQAIVTLADKRNTIAHFETDPRDEAFRMTYGDIATLLERDQTPSIDSKNTSSIFLIASARLKTVLASDRATLPTSSALAHSASRNC